MADRVHKLTRLVVRFHRGGREIEREEASTGERALKFGLLMLARLDYLEAGDRLTVEDDNTGLDHAPLPPPRSRPKQ